MRRYLFILSLLTAVLTASASTGDSCKWVHIVPERLPDMTMPRSGHSVFYFNGELTVVGGHTTNFVPTQTAEYLADGEWHQMQMAYCHDNGFAVKLRSGEVIIGGGHDEPLGVGQSYTLERYQPATHSFEGFGCLDRKRTLANGTQLGDGRVIIGGNHYAQDAIACYDGQSQVKHVKDVPQGFNSPWLLRTAKDNAIIVSPRGTRQEVLDTVWASRVQGDAFRVPLLEQYKVLYLDRPFCSDDSFVGDEAKGDYTSLLAGVDNDGQLAIIQVRDTSFTLLPTICPIPMKSQWGPIQYYSNVVADRQARCAYVVGYNYSEDNRQFVLRIDYGQQPAGLTIYYTDTIATSSNAIPVLTPDGDLILAGGAYDNYKPLAAVWRYHLATPATVADKQDFGSRVPMWLRLLAGLLACALLAYMIIRRRRVPADHVSTPSPASTTEDTAPDTMAPDQLFQRVCRLMEQDQRYLTGLKLSDIAAELGVGVPAIVDCIGSQRDTTYSQLLNEYRVRHAQQLLLERPDMKLSAVIANSGFTSETTFFRSFRTFTGMSPKEWLAQQTGNTDAD